MLQEKLGHPLAQATAEELTELNDVYASIQDGNSTWTEYVDGQSKGPEKGSLKPEHLKPGKEANRGHGDENLGQVAKTAEKSQGAQKTEAKQTSKANQTPQAQGHGNPSYSDQEPDPFTTGELSFEREPGQDG